MRISVPATAVSVVSHEVHPCALIDSRTGPDMTVHGRRPLIVPCGAPFTYSTAASPRVPSRMVPGPTGGGAGSRTTGCCRRGAGRGAGAWRAGVESRFAALSVTGVTAGGVDSGRAAAGGGVVVVP